MAACGGGDQADAPVDFGDPTAPPGSTRLGDAPDDLGLTVVLGLTRDQAGLEDLASRVTDPNSPEYGHYWRLEDVAARFGVSQEQERALLSYFTEKDIDVTIDPTRSHAFVRIRVADAEELFGVSLGRYAIPAGDGEARNAIHADQAPTRFPDEISSAVREVYGLQKPEIGKQVEGISAADNGATPWRTGTAEGCPDALGQTLPDGKPVGLAPNQLQAAYGVDTLQAQGLTGQGVRAALIEFEGFEPSDLDVFTDCFSLPRMNPIIHGTNVPATGSGEAILDLQVLASVAPSLDRTDVFVFDNGTSWVEAFSAALNPSEMDGNLPNVISVSWGNCEQLVYGIGWQNTVNSTNYVLACAAVSGVGVYYAAGDSGSTGCPVGSALAVEWPASSPWVTAVGGTGLTLDDQNEIISEGVWNDEYFASFGYGLQAAGGGGTSTFNARPSWQTGPGISDGNDRLVPDMAFFADVYPGYMTYCTTAACNTNGWSIVGGTSAAAPFFAGSVALITQAAVQRGATVPGFIAPSLYNLARNAEAYPGVFRDVTLGDNDLKDVGCCSAGPNYDLASGWGSADIAQLLEAMVPGALTE